MGFFDDALNKAKETIDVVGQKTGEAVNVQKLRFEIAAVENKREKDLRELGRLCFAKYKNSDNVPADIADIVAAIKEKSVRIGALKTEIAKVQDRKMCPECGAVIDIDSNFCRSCGTKVVYDSAEQADATAEEKEEN